MNQGALYNFYLHNQVVNSIMYVDDEVFVASGKPDGDSKMHTRCEYLRKNCSVMNIAKTEYMIMHNPKTHKVEHDQSKTIVTRIEDGHAEDYTMRINKFPIKYAESFTYLGTWISHDGEWDANDKKRDNMVNKAIGMVKRFCNSSKHLPLQHMKMFCESFVRSSAIFGCECTPSRQNEWENVRRRIQSMTLGVGKQFSGICKDSLCPIAPFEILALDTRLTYLWFASLRNPHTPSHITLMECI